MPNKLILKWGTVKGWDLETEDAIVAMLKWASYGMHSSVIMHRDTPEQRQALLDAIDYMDEIVLDWDERRLTKEEAKRYIMNAAEYERRHAARRKKLNSASS